MMCNLCAGGSKKRDGIRSTSPQSDGSAPGRPHTQTLPPRLLPPRTAVRTLQRIAEGCSKPALFEAEPLKRGVTSVYSLSSHIEERVNRQSQSARSVSVAVVVGPDRTAERGESRSADKG
ncbi:hypothetical protein J6590_045261 [Homalodisca vitripennis]|nr:hypothetical protein J6590_045261 [Homalodisca vitripennis]